MPGPETKVASNLVWAGLVAGIFVYMVIICLGYLRIR